MNNEKRILVIDDESQANNLEKISNDLKSKFKVNYEQIDVLEEHFYDEGLTHYVFSKLQDSIKDALKKSPDLVLVDYDYGEGPGINGINVIQYIRSLRKHVAIILYSADQKKVIREIIGQNIKSASEDKIVEGINALMNYKIEKMCSRNSYEADAVRILKSNLDDSPKNILCHLLRDNGDRTFNSCCPELKGKTFNQIADLLEEDNNGKANEWLNAILQQVIAYLTEVNE